LFSFIAHVDQAACVRICLHEHVIVYVKFTKCLHVFFFVFSSDSGVQKSSYSIKSSHKNKTYRKLHNKFYTE